MLREIHGLVGSIELDGLAPPTDPVGQRLTGDGARVGKMVLGSGHVEFALESENTLLVEELATEVGENGTGGKLFVGAFRYAKAKPELRLDIFASSLDLQHWLDLLGRDEVTGS